MERGMPEKSQVIHHPVFDTCSLCDLQHGGAFFSRSPQQDASLPPQLHSPLSILLPLSAAAIIAQAQPTPLCTVMAWTGQLRAQTPHSIHDAGCVSSA